MTFGFQIKSTINMAPVLRPSRPAWPSAARVNNAFLNDFTSSVPQRAFSIKGLLIRLRLGVQTRPPYAESRPLCFCKRTKRNIVLVYLISKVIQSQVCASSKKPPPTERERDNPVILITTLVIASRFCLTKLKRRANQRFI